MSGGVLYTCGVRDDYDTANKLIGRIRKVYDARVSHLANGDDVQSAFCADLLDDLVATATVDTLRTAVILAATGLAKAEHELADPNDAAAHSGTRAGG